MQAKSSTLTWSAILERTQTHTHIEAEPISGVTVWPVYTAHATASQTLGSSDQWENHLTRIVCATRIFSKREAHATQTTDEQRLHAYAGF